MTLNPLIEEIRQTRERLLAESGGTLAGLADRLRREERSSGRTILRPKPPAALRVHAGDQRGAAAAR